MNGSMSEKVKGNTEQKDGTRVRVSKKREVLGVLLTSAPRMEVLSSSRRSKKLVTGNEEGEKAPHCLHVP